MIYLDNAATTYPKPLSVVRAAERAMLDYGANPGRSGHTLSRITSEKVYAARETCARFFGAEPENTVFTLNCTHALNFAIKGVAANYRRPHIITTDLEHNAVIRPIHALYRFGQATYSIAGSGICDDDLINSIKRLIRPDTKICVITAACNLNGRTTPLKAIARLCGEKGICLIADCAQAAGILPLSLSDGINIICAPGHKGLYGPMGTGLMLTDGKYPLSSIIEGGTGSLSTEITQPDFLPDMLESGTLNTSGVIALSAGIRFVQSKGIDNIRRHEDMLVRRAINALKDDPRVIIYRNDTEQYLPVLAFNISGIPSVKTAEILSDGGFYLRAGYHCAFLPHKKLGTLSGGAVRLAPSAFNTAPDISKFCAYIDRKFK